MDSIYGESKQVHVFLFKNLFLIFAILHLTFWDTLFLLAKHFSSFNKIFIIDSFEIFVLSVFLYFKSTTNIYNLLTN